MQITRDAVLNPKNEKEVYRSKRHPFGIYQLYLAMGIAYAVVLVLLVYGIPESNISFNAQQLGVIWSAFVFAGLVTLGFLVIARHIYWGSELCVTESGVSQVVQLGLFNRRVSRLDMEKVEDVTSQQRGVLQSMFNYGTVIVETAGEQENFIFPYCPKPNDVAQQIHSARQAYNDRHMVRAAETHAEQLSQTLAANPVVQTAPNPAAMPQDPVTPPVQPQQPQTDYNPGGLPLPQYQPTQQPQQPTANSNEQSDQQSS